MKTLTDISWSLQMLWIPAMGIAYMVFGYFMARWVLHWISKEWFGTKEHCPTDMAAWPVLFLAAIYLRIRRKA